MQDGRLGIIFALAKNVKILSRVIKEHTTALIALI